MGLAGIAQRAAAEIIALPAARRRGRRPSA
jgi:hypothetical protein